MRFPKNKKGNVTLYLTFIISAIIIVLVAAVFAPMGVLMNARAYEAGERIMLLGNDSISNINDATVKASLQDTVGDSLSNIEYTVELNSNIFQYSWIFIVLLTALILFLFQRRMVELGAGGVI